MNPFFAPPLSSCDKNEDDLYYLRQQEEISKRESGDKTMRSDTSCLIQTGTTNATTIIPQRTDISNNLNDTIFYHEDHQHHNHPHSHNTNKDNASNEEGVFDGYEDEKESANRRSFGMEIFSLKVDQKRVIDESQDYPEDLPSDFKMPDPAVQSSQETQKREDINENDNHNHCSRNNNIRKKSEYLGQLPSFALPLSMIEQEREAENKRRIIEMEKEFKEQEKIKFHEERKRKRELRKQQQQQLLQQQQQRRQHQRQLMLQQQQQQQQQRVHDNYLARNSSEISYPDHLNNPSQKHKLLTSKEIVNLKEKLRARLALRSAVETLSLITILSMIAFILIYVPRISAHFFLVLFFVLLISSLRIIHLKCQTPQSQERLKRRMNYVAIERISLSLLMLFVYLFLQVFDQHILYLMIYSPFVHLLGWIMLPPHSSKKIHLHIELLARLFAITQAFLFTAQYDGFLYWSWSSIFLPTWILLSSLGFYLFSLVVLLGCTYFYWCRGTTDKYQVKGLTWCLLVSCNLIGGLLFVTIGLLQLQDNNKLDLLRYSCVSIFAGSSFCVLFSVVFADDLEKFIALANSDNIFNGAHQIEYTNELDDAQNFNQQLENEIQQQELQYLQNQQESQERQQRIQAIYEQHRQFVLNVQQQQQQALNPPKKTLISRIKSVPRNFPQFVSKLTSTYFQKTDVTRELIILLQNRNMEQLKLNKENKKRQTDNSLPMNSKADKVNQPVLKDNNYLETKTKVDIIENNKDEEFQKRNKTQNEENKQSTGNNIGNEEEIQKISSTESIQQCLVCFDNSSDSVNLECGHGGLCFQCAVDVWKKTGECYLCRQKITKVVQISNNKELGKFKRIVAVATLSEESFSGIKGKKGQEHREDNTFNNSFQQIQQGQLQSPSRSPPRQPLQSIEYNQPMVVLNQISSRVENEHDKERQGEQPCESTERRLIVPEGRLINNQQKEEEKKGEICDNGNISIREQGDERIQNLRGNEEKKEDEEESKEDKEQYAVNTRYQCNQEKERNCIIELTSNQENNIQEQSLGFDNKSQGIAQQRMNHKGSRELNEEEYAANKKIKEQEEIILNNYHDFYLDEQQNDRKNEGNQSQNHNEKIALDQNACNNNLEEIKAQEEILKDIENHQEYQQYQNNLFLIEFED